MRPRHRQRKRRNPGPAGLPPAIGGAAKTAARGAEGA